MEGGKNKILIVDDDVLILDMYSLKFSQNNFDVCSALGSAVAIDKLKCGLRPDIILSDVLMPDMDGLEMLEKIKKEKLSENSLKIILSNKGEPEDFERAKGIGVDGYIIKATATPSEVVTQVKDIFIKKTSTAK